jgi:glycerol-3-phosphate O-acyltransferase
LPLYAQEGHADRRSRAHHFRFTLEGVQPPIFGFNQARDRIVDEVARRVCEAVRDPLLALNEAAFLEVRRQETGGRDDVVPLGEWRGLAHSIGRMSEAEGRAKIAALARRYARDVAGNFDPRVYRFASRAVAPLIGMLMSPTQTLKHLGGAFDLRALDGRVVIEGPLGRIRTLAEKGTLVFVPTHLSNLDSVVFGFALERAGLPPATYGAGKNLFANPLLSFFIHNLGAYRVDRRIRHTLYKDVLKAYSCVLLEQGYHSLFFPGGTRSRSGAVERHLKLGLAGTGVEAMARTAARGEARHVFFVPATINYLLTLEAETLVDDFLQEEGKHRYIIEDDESSRAIRIASFLRKLLGLDAACVIRFGRPLDCFGNEVDDDAVSHDARGHAIDRLTYLTDAERRVAPDAARDAQYTRELGEAIVAAFQRDTVAMATHLVAACAFAKLCEKTSMAAASRDIFALLRSQDDVVVPRGELADCVQRIRDRARELEARGRLVLRPHLVRATGREILDEALRAFSGYHTTPVLQPRGADLVLVDTRLIFYYQNRLAAHGLAADLVALVPRSAEPKAGPPAWHPSPSAHDFTGNPARFALGSRASSP